MFLLNNEKEESPKDILLNEFKYKIRILAGIMFAIKTIPMVINAFNEKTE
ncbi:hypothetical protein PFAG_02412 [Plasmodium falciparum Santa Lucia]|uniref:Uncharacterized protein n=12 Tax=Plasmodium falciparum TaxID=5833 RepID=C0H541_PLAF7|nr:conserved Plasmodium protein, unknown function [Plasmodium falciparum 3D7]ETW18566.1 hypothetical protein PFFVO_02465 [Plasmodium falciparum Vietnam Oak-Knoll (FVO)]ETW36784.1 hypothetical protein PFTANZ_02505 [Plasmodium falciparum Tanzania (2000708)]ETW43109.1 hypothetical protein PFNF135_02584 [Plasmodium falciparum NF135/5.C10]ETW49529.1 hypothetical protein PFMALIP_02457 [Plasmodium falciparum MaliPS096_E11]ETW55111.1 hypothetical protein PFUGPA_02933 [Plasmodium falciparum Palo Alto/U|eukprot:XP_002808937.1 conserved Plasmodium protein, unknown function [Plasmodium falciparum 3D7]